MHKQNVGDHLQPAGHYQKIKSDGIIDQNLDLKKGLVSSQRIIPPSLSSRSHPWSNIFACLFISLRLSECLCPGGTSSYRTGEFVIQFPVDGRRHPQICLAQNSLSTSGQHDLPSWCGEWTRTHIETWPFPPQIIPLRPGTELNYLFY